MQSKLWQTNDITDEMNRNGLEYGMAVNTDRSLPDAKDGLKPVHKRSIYDAFDLGFLSNKPHAKSARVVGDTMGRFHPHGDSSIYGAIVRLAQPWVMRYPLFDGHGNFGNISGDSEAAMRYTEVRLTKISEDGLLAGLKKKNVDFIPNYDDKEEEPVCLPAIFPNLLCNPNDGIGWAMAGSWAPHNLREVAQAIYDYMDGKEPMLPGPDFPTGGIVINQKDIPSIMKTGHGSVKIRGKYHIEKNDIVFTEIPYGTRIEKILNEIGERAFEGKIPNVTEVRNESDKKGIRIVITVEKNANPEAVVLKLFEKTSLQNSFSYNQIALVDKTPTELNLKDCCKVYVEHNIDCLIRECQFDLSKATNRLHIVEGLLKALEDIDNIIALIKKSGSAGEAKTALIEKYKFSEEQAKAILDMKLSRLAKLEKVELEEEKATLIKTIDKLNDLIQNKDSQIKEIKARLDAIVKKYGDARRTEIAQIEVPKAEKEIAAVVPEDVVVIATQSGLIKKIPAASFKVQRKGGVGVKNQDDALLDVCKTNTVDVMMFFSTKGKMYRCLVDRIPDGTNATKGQPIASLVSLDIDEKIIAVSSLHRKTKPKYVIFITKQGMIKKTYLEEYEKTNRNSGVAALTLREGDELADIIFQDDEELILITKKGMGIRFQTTFITPVGRIALGIKGIKLNEGDEVLCALPIHKESDYLAVITENGMGKKLNLTELTTQARGGKGVIITSKDSIIAGAAMVDDTDSILVCGNYSSICIAAKDLPIIGRTGLGNILIKNNRVSSIAKI